MLIRGIFDKLVMVDIQKRKKLAIHLRHLSVGLLSNDDFESSILDDVSSGWLPEEYYRSKEAKYDDRIIKPMLEWCWGLYSDTRNHKLIGRDALPEEVLKTIARCILFLQTDKEYEWPYFDSSNSLLRFSLGEIVISILSLGQYLRDKKKEKGKKFEEFKKFGDYHVWPFHLQTEYEEHLKQHPFLVG